MAETTEAELRTPSTKTAEAELRAAAVLGTTELRAAVAEATETELWAASAKTAEAELRTATVLRTAELRTAVAKTTKAELWAAMAETTEATESELRTTAVLAMAELRAARTRTTESGMRTARRSAEALRAVALLAVGLRAVATLAVRRASSLRTLSPDFRAMVRSALHALARVLARRLWTGSRALGTRAMMPSLDLRLAMRRTARAGLRTGDGPVPIAVRTVRGAAKRHSPEHAALRAAVEPSWAASLIFFRGRGFIFVRRL